MSSTHLDAVAKSEQLEKISDNNLIKFFEAELLLIDSGTHASTILNTNIIQNLIRLGILKPAKWRGRGKRGLSLTDKARFLLKSQ